MSRTGAQNVVRILAWSVLLPGLIVTLGSFGWAVRTLRFGMTTVEGRVTGRSTAKLTDAYGRTRYRDHATVTFTTRDGRTVTFSDSLAGAPIPYRVGSSVRVRYDEKNPSNAEVVATSVLGLTAAAVFFIIGIMTSALGAILLLAARLPWQVSN